MLRIGKVLKVCRLYVLFGARCGVVDIIDNM